MSFKVPSTREEIYNSVAQKVKTNLPKSNPWLRYSWIRAVLIGIAFLFFDLYQTLLIAIDDFFDDTASFESIKRKAKIYDMTPDAALQSSGFISLIGTPGSTIDITASLVHPSGATFTPKASATIANVLVH